jgi:hypothetical protein
MVVSQEVGGLGNHKPTPGDPQIDRGINFRISELVNHIAARNAKLRCSKCDIRRNIERSNTNYIEIRPTRLKTKGARRLIEKRAIGIDASRRQNGRHFIEDPSLR